MVWRSPLNVVGISMNKITTTSHTFRQHTGEIPFFSDALADPGDFSDGEPRPELKLVSLTPPLLDLLLGLRLRFCPLGVEGAGRGCHMGREGCALDGGIMGCVVAHVGGRGDR